MNLHLVLFGLYSFQTSTAVPSNLLSGLPFPVWEIQTVQPSHSSPTMCVCHWMWLIDPIFGFQSLEPYAVNQYVGKLVTSTQASRNQQWLSLIRASWSTSRISTVVRPLQPISRGLFLSTFRIEPYHHDLALSLQRSCVPVLRCDQNRSSIANTHIKHYVFADETRYSTSKIHQSPIVVYLNYSSWYL
jgi:hypothetical protein